VLLNRPANKEELFNLHHSQARNMIEQIFGVLKHCFQILLLAPEFSVKIQAKIPAALCAIHNFIHHCNPQKGEISENIDSKHSNYTSHAGDETVGPGMESEIDDSNVHVH
jgi:DDE superfamily endonuclease